MEKRKQEEKNTISLDHKQEEERTVSNPEKYCCILPLIEEQPDPDSVLKEFESIKICADCHEKNLEIWLHPELFPEEWVESATKILELSGGIRQPNMNKNAQRLDKNI